MTTKERHLLAFASLAGFAALAAATGDDEPQHSSSPVSSPASPPAPGQASPTASASVPEDPKWNELREEFGALDTKTLLARVKLALAVDPPTSDSVREADMALAFVPERDEKRRDVRQLKALIDKKGRQVIDNDPEKRAELDRGVRKVLAHQMERNLVRQGIVESVSDDEDPKGAILRFHGDRCSQEFVNAMAANEAKFELRKAGWRRIVCHKSMFKWYDADL